MITPYIAIGCMRLSTAADRDEARAIEVLHAALDAGVTLFDTANAYCLDATETGHNERLIARALALWSGDRSTVRIATKGGLTRPEGRWEADGRARALTAACESSLSALGVGTIDLYQLHAPDPRVPLATSVRALHALRRRGLIDAVGLCNVTVGQIEEARRITDDRRGAGRVESVARPQRAERRRRLLHGQWHSAARVPPARRPGIGVESRRIPCSRAWPPITSARRSRSRSPRSPASRRSSLPLPGPTRVETARSAAGAARVTLTDDDRALLRDRFAVCRAGRARAAP